MTTLKNGARTVVLGGGIGGVTVARRLRDLLRPEDDVVLIEKSDRFLFAGTTLWVLNGERTPEQLTRPYSSLGPYGIDFRQVEVTGLDLQEGVVKTARGDIAYDYLVVALGAELHMERIPGLPEIAFNLYSPPDALRLHNTVQSFHGGHVVVAVSSLPFKCPAGPYEAALVLDGLLRRIGARQRSTVDLYSPEPMPIGAAGRQAADRLVSFMAERGIVLHMERTIESVDSSQHRVRFKDGDTVDFDILAVVPPHEVAIPVRESTIAGPQGWIPVDHDSLTTNAERVYALGDVTTVTLPSGRPLPKTAVFARAQAEVVARTIAIEVRGHGQPSKFMAIGGCQLETGDGQAFAIEGNFSTTPQPDVQLKGPSVEHHLTKEALEQSALALVN